MKIVIIDYGAVVFDEQVAYSIFTSVFDNKITDSEQIVFQEDSPPTYSSKKISADKKTMDFEITGTAFKVPDIDKGRISSEINGKDSQSAIEQLTAAYGADSVEISITPSWWIDKLPIIKQAIKIEYGFVDKQESLDQNTEEIQ